MRAARWLTALSATFVLLLTSCGSSAPSGGAGSKPADDGKTTTVVIGFTTSKTGKLNVESSRQVNGLNLWLEQVNKSGRVKLADGRVVKFEAKYYDDESVKNRVQELYTRLISEDKADFLISPYSSGLADAAALIAEQNGRILVTAGAASDSTHQKGFSLVYQVYTPASRYLTGTFDLLGKADPSAKNITIIHENDKFSTDVCTAAKKYGESKGFKIGLFEGYESGTTDFAPFINKIPAQTEAILGGGHFADGSTFARQLYEKNVKAKFVALLVAPPEPKFAELGASAAGVVGPSQWEPAAAYSAEVAAKAGKEWFGPNIAEFVSAYRAAYGNDDPSYHSAGGYMAGLLLERAIAKAGSTETTKVKAELDALNLMTFFGAIKFSVDTATHGLQVGHEMVYIQWQKGADGKLIKQVVWPEAGKTAEPVYPIR